MSELAESPNLSEKELKKFIEKTLRGAFKKSPLYSAAKNRAKEEFFVESKTGKPQRRVHLKCAICGRYFFDARPKTKTRDKVPSEIAVDHIEPVVSIEGCGNYDTYISRLYCSIDNLQVLCNYKGERDGVLSCHKIKTKQENDARRALKPKKKKVKNVL